MLYVYRRPRKSFKPRPFAVFPALLRRFSTASKGGGCGTTVLAASLASSLDRVEVAPVLLVADGGVHDYEDPQGTSSDESSSRGFSLNRIFQT